VDHLRGGDLCCGGGDDDADDGQRLAAVWAAVLPARGGHCVAGRSGDGDDVRDDVGDVVRDDVGRDVGDDVRDGVVMVTMSPGGFAAAFVAVAPPRLPPGREWHRSAAVRAAGHDRPAVVRA
jgi:hypothetical protein